jgi:hypothetical protein
MNKVKNSQKIRIVSGNICFYTTAKQIRYGLGDFYNFNSACQKALFALEHHSPDGAVGIAGTWDDINIQLDLSIK